MWNGTFLLLILGRYVNEIPQSEDILRESHPFTKMSNIFCLGKWKDLNLVHRHLSPPFK